jgi:prepilin-type N-terminal cleavage/methylation domain-containing protein
MKNTKPIPPFVKQGKLSEARRVAKMERHQNRLSQSGFTIVESLVAMLIISILMTVIAPVIVLSVGNRVQARRVELASGAARAYIDGVESGIIEPPKHTITLDEVDDNKNFNAQRLLFAGVATPLAAEGLPCKANTTGNSYCSNTLFSSLYCIDLDRNGCSINSAKDLVVQAFRSFTPISTDDNRSVSPVSTDADKGYLLGIRVYRADAFSDDTPIAKSDSETKRTQLTFSSGLGNRKTPLVEMTTEIVTNKATFRDMCDRLGCQDAQDTQDAQ